VARKSPQRPNAEEPQAEAAKPETAKADVDTGEAGLAGDGAVVADGGDTAEDGAAAGKADTVTEASPDDGDRSLWTDTNIDPIEIALPSGVGYTLRAYRMSTDLAPTDIEDREEEDDPFAARAVDDLDDDEVVILDEEFAALTADERPARRSRGGDDADEDDADEEDAERDESDDAVAASDEAADEDEEDKAGAEEVPFFLTHRGKLLIFKSPESLVAFVRSGAPNDLAQLDTWTDLAERIQPADVSAADDDSYELDLVVENLRGGHDTWDLDLLIRAGELARDLGYALRLAPVLTALSAGSPLDDLDEALRSAAGGGIGGFMGRRRLRRIGAQQASLGWRTIIGKISAAVDWRD
jgi:hypothetical protein